MFERYTEKARRIIFFARYEASQFGSRTIEAEHLLLGLLREDRPLATALLKTEAAIDSIRQQIEAHATKRAQISTSADLPLSPECKRMLGHGAEEAERLNHRHITPAHLLIGILRESNSLAASMLRDRQVTMEIARAHAIESYPQSAGVPSPPPPATAPPPALLHALAEREKAGGITVIVGATVAGRVVGIAIYEGEGVVTTGDPLAPPDPSLASSPAHRTAALWRKIKYIGKCLEDAIAGHDFAAARAYSDQERGLREVLRGLPSDETPPDPIPFLCIFILDDESLPRLRARLDACFAEGVQHVWMLDPAGHRIYTATREEGLREVLAETLSIPHPPIEIPRGSIF